MEDEDKENLMWMGVMVLFWWIILPVVLIVYTMEYKKFVGMLKSHSR